MITPTCPAHMPGRRIAVKNAVAMMDKRMRMFRNMCMCLRAPVSRGSIRLDR